MTTEQALQILDQATAVAPLTRPQHQQVGEALKTIQEALEPTVENKVKK